MNKCFDSGNCFILGNVIKDGQEGGSCHRLVDFGGQAIRLAPGAVIKSADHLSI